MPLLFPFAGRVFHNGQALQYSLDNELLRMPLHGFAYAQPWEVVSATKSRATLRLKAGPRTRELYPFEFELTATYELSEQSLHTEVVVTNRGSRERDATGASHKMPVAMGWHPYFHTPFVSDSAKTRPSADSSAVMNLYTSASAQTRVTPVGGAGRTTAFPEAGDAPVTKLSDLLLHNLILGHHKKPEAELHDGTNKLALKLNWSELNRYLVLWTKSGQGFHCVEPWMGLPDAVNNGEGVQWLSVGESLHYHFTLSLSHLPK